MISVTCVQCDTPFTYEGHGGRRRRYCSEGCRNRKRAGYVSYAPRCAVSYADCAECGDTFVVRRAAKPGDSPTCRKPECRRLMVNRQQRTWTAGYRAKNGVSYAAERFGERRRSENSRRRARLAGAANEKFSDSEIFERDGWVCQICGDPVDPNLAWPDPMYRSLDHCVPLSRGGSHTKANVQLAHLSCNSRKGDKEAV